MTYLQMWRCLQSFLLYMNSHCHLLQLNYHHQESLFRQLLLPIRKYHLYPF